MRPAIVLAMIAAVAGLAGLAHAQPVRKPPSADLAPKAAEAFVRARIRDKSGDLQGARQSYDDSNRQQPSAKTYYNLGDVERRLDRPREAVAAYRKYLELAPKAADRASVAKLVAQLEASSPKLSIHGLDLVDAVVFIDGKLAGPSPVTVEVKPGRHLVERIGALGYAADDIEVAAMDRKLVTLSTRTKHDKPKTGNVIFSRNPVSGRDYMTGRWFYREGKRPGFGAHDDELELPSRRVLKPGRHTGWLRRPRSCETVSFDVAPGNAVTYVYFDGPTDDNLRESVDVCAPINVRVQSLKLPP